MNNYVSAGKTMEVVAPSGGLTGGQVYLVQNTLGVVAHTVLPGETAILNIEPGQVYTVPKAAVAFSQGARVYWDNTALNMTTSAGGNTLAGVSMETLASGITSAPVRWNGSF